MKHCAKCGEYKQEKDFFFDVHNGRYCSYCKPCNSAYQRANKIKTDSKEFRFKKIYGWTKETHPREFLQFKANDSYYG